MISHSGVQVVVDSEGVWDSGCGARGLDAEMRWRELTGTLGSDTAMLSGCTAALTHWLRVAAKRKGSSARSQRLLWEQLGWKREDGQELEHRH